MDTLTTAQPKQELINRGVLENHLTHEALQPRIAGERVVFTKYEDVVPKESPDFGFTENIKKNGGYVILFNNMCRAWGETPEEAYMQMLVVLMGTWTPYMIMQLIDGRDSMDIIREHSLWKQEHCKHENKTTIVKGKEKKEVGQLCKDCSKVTYNKE